MPHDLIKKSGVQRNAEEFQISSDFYDELDERVKEIVERAKERAKESGRNTLQPRDV